MYKTPDTHTTTPIKLKFCNYSFRVTESVSLLLKNFSGVSKFFPSICSSFAGSFETKSTSQHGISLLRPPLSFGILNQVYTLGWTVKPTKGKNIGYPFKGHGWPKSNYPLFSYCVYLFQIFWKFPSSFLIYVSLFFFFNLDRVRLSFLLPSTLQL